MYLFDWFRSFRPLHNPIGFGASDFVVLALALLLAGLIVLRAVAGPWEEQIAKRTPLAMASFLCFSILLRLALLPRCPAPTPSGADDFSYILLGDTIRHLRLANAPHAVHQFFESVFVLQEPTYSSIYPLGQGIVLALGRVFLGTFWAGVLLSMASFPCFCYWMLRGWVSPRWAFAGGLLAVAEFGPLNQWMNSYWGGAVAACGGCLVFGALPRLRRFVDGEEKTNPRRDSVLLGVGLALQLLTRPFEFVLLAGCVALYWLLTARGGVQWAALARPAGWVALLVAAAGALTLGQNKAVTGSWTTLPYMLSRYQYGVPTTFTFQPNPVPHRQLTPEQDLDYRAQAAIHGTGTDTIGAFFGRLIFRGRYLRFFLFAPLYFALAVFLVNLRQPKWLFVAITVAVFAMGTNFYPYFFPHYTAAVACLLVLMAVQGLATASEWRLGRQAAGYVLLACGVQFVFWYGIHFFSNEQVLPVTRYEAWDFINHGDPQGRIAANHALAAGPGRQVVFVRYWAQHRFEEWIGNGADIDGEKVVWGLDLGKEENQKLLDYFSGRHAWLLEPDAEPPKLSPYRTSESP